MAKLLLFENGSERSVEIDRAVVEIGRGADNAVVIADPRSSRKHCRLSRTPQGWVLEDLKSRNGTTVNGTAVEKKFLHGGDEFQIGATRFRLIEDRSPASPGGAPRAVPAIPPGVAAASTIISRAPAPQAVPPRAPAPPAAESPLSSDDDALLLEDPGSKDEGEEPAVQPAAAPVGPVLRLQVLDPSGTKAMEIDHLPFKIGRRKGNDLVVSDQKASGDHARIVERDGLPWLEDLDSRNGTILDHQRVKEGRLRTGSVIKIGGTAIRVELPGVPEESARTAPEDDGEPSPIPDAAGGIGEDDFTRFDAREFLRDADRGASPLSVAAILLVLGTILYFAIDITLKSVRRVDLDPAAEGNLVGNWSFEERTEGGGVPGWEADEGTQASISIVHEGAQYPGNNALGLKASSPGLALARPRREIQVDPNRRYRLQAHVMNGGAFAAGVAVDWLAEAGGRKVTIGRDWGAALREDVKAEDLDRALSPPAEAVFARISPFVITTASGGAASFDRVYFGEDAERPAGAEGSTSPEEGGASAEDDEPVEVVASPPEGNPAAPGPGGAASMAGGAGAPLRLLAACDGTIREVRRGARPVLSSLFVGLAPSADPLAIGPRLLARLRDESERDGVLLVAQLPDVSAGEWFPLEERVRPQGSEVGCEFRIGRGRTKESPIVERAAFYLEVPPTTKEVMAFGGSLKAPVTFPPDRPPAEGPLEELLFGSGAEQVALVFSPPVTLKVLEGPAGLDRKLLVAEAVVPQDAQARSSVLSVRFSPFSRREDEAAAGLLREAAASHEEGKTDRGRALLADLRARFPWRAGDLARAQGLEKEWADEGARALKELQAACDDLAASPSPVIRDALLSRAGSLRARFRGTPSEEGLAEVERRVRAQTSHREDPSLAQRPTLVREAREHLDRGEIGLAALCLELAHAGKLEGTEEDEVRHMENLLAEKAKQKAIEEVR